MDILANPEIRFLFQILLAFFLGSLIGMEREYIGKEAGIRTFSLVCIGSMLFTTLSREGFLDINENVDPSRIASGMVMGIGFLVSGIIIFRGAQIEGLTTAAGLWIAAAIGMAIGCQFYYLATISTLITFIILSLSKKLKIDKVETKK